MDKELTTTANQLAVSDPSKVSLLDMRMDSKRYPRIGAYTREQAVFEMSRIVTQAFLYRGQTADTSNIQFISCSLVDELQADLDRLGMKNISFGEISRVIKRAVLQDEMYGISVASLYKVIVEYVKGEGHRLQEEADERKRRSEQEQLKNSIVAPMLQAYAGQLIKNSKA